MLHGLPGVACAFALPLLVRLIWGELCGAFRDTFPTPSDYHRP